MILDGYIKDKYDQPVEQAVVELKNNSFETLFTACTDTEGYYRFDIPAGYYPFFFAVKGYKEVAWNTGVRTLFWMRICSLMQR